MSKVNIVLSLVIILSTTIQGQVDQAIIDINDTVSLTLERTKFDPTGKTIEWYDKKFAFSIDGRPIFGSDGELPKFTLSKATLRIAEDKYELQVDDMYNPWFGGQPYEKLFSLKKEGTEIRLRCIFSDGAGSYGAEWLIVGRSNIRTILTRDEWILFEYFKD